MLSFVFAVVLLYVLPGAVAARIFTDRTRWNPFLWVLLSLFCLPVALCGLGTIGLPIRSRESVIVAVALVTSLLFIATELARRAGCGLRLHEPHHAARSPWVGALARHLRRTQMTSLPATWQHCRERSPRTRSTAESGRLSESKPGVGADRSPGR